MSDAGIWGQKLIKEQTGIRASIPPAPGPQEAIVATVGTAFISIAGEPASELPVVYFSMPNIFGVPLFGPAVYQPLPGSAPTPGTPCVVMFVGNGMGRPYVVSFPTATFTFAVPSGDTEFLQS